jgi:hypothetical protein
LEKLRVQRRTEHPSQNTTSPAGVIDWNGVKYWREIVKIPGDPNWNGDNDKLDGIPLRDASDEIKSMTKGRRGTGKQG